MKFRKLSACLFLVARSTLAFSSKKAAAATGVRPYHSPVMNQHQQHGGQKNPSSKINKAVAAARNPLLVRRDMSSGGSDTTSELPAIRHINKEEMKQILMEHEGMVNADLESPYFVLDVRTEPEVQQTGQLAASVPTLPVQLMMPPYSVLQMDDDEFEESFGFPKPPKDVTMVFSCAAGIRSVSACKFAQEAGYRNCINYMGGAKEWFYP